MLAFAASRHSPDYGQADNILSLFHTDGKSMTDAFVPSARSNVKRMPKRGYCDRATVYAILDAGFICHV